MAYGDLHPAPESFESFEIETCLGCGATVAVEHPVFLEWDADLVGGCICPDCRASEAAVAEALPAGPRRAA